MLQVNIQIQAKSYIRPRFAGESWVTRKFLPESGINFFYQNHNSNFNNHKNVKIICFILIKIITRQKEIYTRFW